MPDPLDAEHGFYLPGPPGSDHGDFWVGDTVRVHTGFGPFDYNEVDARVTAITITIDDDNHELIVIPELVTIPPPPETVPAFARIYIPNALWTSGPPINWRWPGETPQPGAPYAPLVGPVHYIDGTGPAAGYKIGVGIDGTGTLAITSIGSLNLLGTATVTWSIRLNGTPLVSGTGSTSSGHYDLDWNLSISGVAVVPGDILDTYVSATAGPFGCPSGTGAGQYFQVSGHLVP